MTGLAATRLEELLAMRGISRSLLGEGRSSDGGLPEVSRGGLNFVIRRTKLRHFGGGTEFGRFFQPVWNPFLVNLHPNFFQVRTDFLDFLEQVVGALFELLDLRVHAGYGYGEIGGLRVVGVGGVVVGGGVAFLVELRDLQAIILLLVFELRDHLTRADQL